MLGIRVIYVSVAIANHSFLAILIIVVSVQRM
jgi:hypothetical protein